jgi:hypothetical protein
MIFIPVIAKHPIVSFRIWKIRTSKRYILRAIVRSWLTVKTRYANLKSSGQALGRAGWNSQT